MPGLEQLKLSHKGIILVSVPLLFGVIFVFTLSYLLNQAEQEASRAAHAKRIMEQIDGVQRSLVDAGISTIGSAATHVSMFTERYENAVAAARQHLEDLSKEVAGDKQLEGDVAHYEELADKGFKIIERIREYTHRSSGRIYAAALGMRLKAMLEETELEAQSLISKLKTREGNIPQMESRSREMVQYLLFLGVAFNIVLSLLLALFFSKGVVNRLGVLTDNSRRLADGASLNPPLSGSDEIANLDSVFHSMAAALAEAARKERAIVENAVDVICSIDADDKFSAANAAAVESWGYSKEELIGQAFIDLCVEEDREKNRKALEDIRSGRTVAMFENRIRRKDGSVEDALWSMHWVEGERSTFCVVHDITDRKEVERMRKEFVSMVTHDLKTPLTSIQGALGLLVAGASGPLPKDATDLVTMAERNTTRLLKLVMDLVQLERMESGKLELQNEKVRLTTIFERSLEAVKVFAEQQEVKLVANATGVEVYADGDRIIQVLVNLLSNAVKFSPKGGTVTVDCEQSDDWYEVKVIDQGRGIPPAFRDAVFERFKQVEVSDATKKGGSGLGLPICKMIIEQHGGIIGVDSELGKGSTFWFRLPRNPLLQVSSS